MISAKIPPMERENWHNLPSPKELPKTLATNRERLGRTVRLLAGELNDDDKMLPEEEFIDSLIREMIIAGMVFAGTLEIPVGEVLNREGMWVEIVKLDSKQEADALTKATLGYLIAIGAADSLFQTDKVYLHGTAIVPNEEGTPEIKPVGILGNGTVFRPPMN